MRPTWTKVIVGLLALWAVFGSVLWWLHSRKPTTTSVVRFVDSHPLDGKSESERRKIIEEVAAQVNRMDPEEREKARPNRSLEDFWKKLSDAEKGHYFSLVVPRGLQIAIERFNRMPPDKQRREIEKAVQRMRDQADEELPEDFDPKLAKRFVDEGLKTFYRDATIEAKMNALPLLEELERSFRWK